MSYILDTHALLWWLSDPDLLSSEAKEIVTDIKNLIYVSSVSTWEIAVKLSLGKLKAPKQIFDIIKRESFFELPISIEHTKCLSLLPDHHKDPFDRLLIAQAIVEKSVLITSDKMIRKYPIPIIIV